MRDSFEAASKAAAFILCTTGIHGLFEKSPEQLRKLVGMHGSPLVVGSRSIVRQQLQRLRKSLPMVELFFAVKANSDAEILQILAREGCGFDIASFQELVQVKQAVASVEQLNESNRKASKLYSISVTQLGLSSSDILHSHPCKSPDDIKSCCDAGQQWFVFDCESELLKLAALAPKSRLLIRLNVPNRSGRVAFSHRFGAELRDVVSLARKSQSLEMRVEGLVFHVGSQAVDPADFEESIALARKAWDLLRENGFEPSVLDIGGGFPVAYRDQLVPSLEAYCNTIAKELDENFGEFVLQIIAEPGRILCAEAVSSIVSVIGKQRRNGKIWYTIDDGLYGTFSGRYFSTDTFDFFPFRLSRASDSDDLNNRLESDKEPTLRSSDHAQTPVELSMIAGPTCDGGDIIAVDYPLPELEIGDFLIVPNLGAYSAVSATDFNGMPKAKHIWIE